MDIAAQQKTVTNYYAIIAVVRAEFSGPVFVRISNDRDAKGLQVELFTIWSVDEKQGVDLLT